MNSWRDGQAELWLCVKGECDPALGAEFMFSVRSKELIIGDVYVRIYNEQPTFPLEVSQNVAISARYSEGLLFRRFATD